MAMKFRESPEFQRGRSGEQAVAAFLRRRGWYIIPSYDYSGEDGDKAPKLEGLHIGHPVPDLDAAQSGKRFWVEVKTKGGATFNRKRNRLEHGICVRHYRAYLEVQRITGAPVFLAIVEEDTGITLCARLDQLPAVFYEGAKMDRGGMVFFPRDAFAAMDKPPCS
jgi:hypothetical protein